MTDFWLATAGWLGHTALVGGAVLLLGWLGLRVVKGPARRQRLAAWAVRAAVLAPMLCLLPAWLTVPAPFESGEQRAVSGEPEQTTDEPPLPTPPAGTELASASHAPGWDVELTLDPVAMPDPPPVRDWRPPPPAEHAAPPPEPATPAPAPAPPLADAGSPLTAHRSPLADALPLVLAAYGLVVVALLGQLLIGHLGLVRLVRAARPAPFRVRAVFDELAVGMRRVPRLLVCDRVASPVCFGLWRPTVLLPASLARSGTEAELRWVFAHELDHVRRGDPATGWWVGVARAVYFFVPWFWALRRELVLAQEYLADAAAATAHGRPADYAAFLVDLSGGPARVPLAAHAVRAGGSDLFRRVTMLLQSGAGLDRRCPRGWAALAAGGVLSAAVLLSGLGVASADDEKPTKAKEERIVQKKVEKDKAAQEREKAAQEREKARQEAERARAAERAARDRDREREGAGAADANVDALKKAIAEAARAGNVDEVKRLADRLERALANQRAPKDGERPRDPNRPRDPDRPQPPRVPRPPALPGVPGVPNVPGVPAFPGVPFDQRQAEQMKRAMEQAERALKEAMEGLKDNPEAREQMERALKEMQRGMEEGMKRAAEAQDRLREWRRVNPDAPFPGGFPEGFGGFGGFERRPAGAGRLGVAVAPVGEVLAEQLDIPAGRGVVVVNVIPGGAAEKAGIKKNDVILTFAGQSVDPGRFPEVVAARTKAGEKVEVIVLRKGKKEAIKGVELPEAPKGDRRPEGVRELRVPDGGRVLRVPAPGKIGFEKMQVQINDGEFTIDATRGDTRYRLSGTTEDGKTSASRIEVTGADKKRASYQSLEDVPEEHRAAVRQLLTSVGGGR